MSYEMNTPVSPSIRFDPFDMSSSQFPFKPISFAGRPHTLTLAEQAELEFELRYRGNMIVDQQRKIQQLEEELKRVHDQMEMMNTQLSSFEQERMKEKKKPQSRYWTPEEHQRFLEALNKYGHKDVKAISMHVSTRNATQVRTHAQKYFLRLERERRKKVEDNGTGSYREKEGEAGYDSLDDGSFQDQDSPLIGDDSNPSSPPTVPASSSGSASPTIQLPVRVPIPPRRRRSVSMITPTLMKFALQHRDAVLALLSPSWTADDFDQFVKGLVAMVDKQEDITQVCHAIREGFLSHHSLDEVESCYRHLHKFLKQKPMVSSPKRRRAISKPECVMMNLSSSASLIHNNSEVPLPAMGGLSIGSPNLHSSHNQSSPYSFLSHSAPQITNGGFHYPSINLNGNMGSISIPNQSSSISSTMFSPINNSNGNNGVGNMMRSSLDFGNVPSVMDMDLSAPSLALNTMGSLAPPAWNSLTFSFDLQNVPPSLSLPQSAPMVSSHN